ncbi:MAG: hypothetical protein HUU25_12825 [Candidatus Sumerlaeia bacterium]|nr:hypothetical protein [Candidatus Sumerlaeia bacterium]
MMTRGLAWLTVAAGAVAGLGAAPIVDHPGVYAISSTGVLTEIPGMTEREFEPLAAELGATLREGRLPMVTPEPLLHIYLPGEASTEWDFGMLNLANRAEGDVDVEMTPHAGGYNVTFPEPLTGHLLLVIRGRHDIGHLAMIVGNEPVSDELVAELEHDARGEVASRQAEATPEPEPLNTRVRADLRVMATAIEAYTVDHGTCPAAAEAGSPLSVNAGHPLMSQRPSFTLKSGGPALTTPIAYITSLIPDRCAGTGTTYAYAQVPETGPLRPVLGAWLLLSPGPDLDWDIALGDALDVMRAQTYDPTNGIASGGDLWRAQRETGH